MLCQLQPICVNRSVAELMERAIVWVGGSKRNDWQSTYGFDLHSVSSTPTALFVNPGSKDFRLKVSSPAVNMGTASFNGFSAPTMDILNNNRPFGSAHDAGAFEYVG